MEREIIENQNRQQPTSDSFSDGLTQSQNQPQAQNLQQGQVSGQMMTGQVTNQMRNRELNPVLFSDFQLQNKVIDGPAQSQLPHLMQTEQKVNEMKTQLTAMAEHVGHLTQQFTELVKNSQLKFERIQQVLLRLESNDQQILDEATQKFSQVNTRLGERKATDGKVQEMIDRHNSVLKSFEMRLMQMQKIVMEKEAQILTAQATLNEAKMEIARLKRL